MNEEAAGVEGVVRFPPKRGIFTEFQYNEPGTTFSITGNPVVLAATVVLVNDLTDRVWLNGTVDWQFRFSTSGLASVLFEILRENTVIYSARQTIPLTASSFPTSLYGHVHLQHVDTAPITTPGVTPVLYTLRATLLQGVGAAFTQNQPVLTAAEIERNLL
ncbi:MAG TPA: hypothetical protein GX507_04410 [Clostridia bacterium]|nr:hypothetical protein [Clostridia bacterium]